MPEPTRLIEWTGERLVPWTDEAQTVYEHFHRYLWASSLVEGRRVLDLGSGEGYGTALLAGRAASATGVDIDPQAVEHSRRHHHAENLEFSVGSIVELESLPAGSFDAVVGFEVIEHVADHARVLEGIAHVLAPGGIVVLSTPDRKLYSDATGFENPYHEHELSEAEFRELLEPRFAHLRLFGQRAIGGSWMHARDGGADVAPTTFFLARDDDVWAPSDEPDPMYLVAVASDEALPAAASVSLLLDGDLEAARRWQRATAAAEDRAGREYARAEHLQHDVVVVTADRDRLQRELTALLEKFNAHEQDRLRLQAEVNRVQNSEAWRLLERTRAIAFHLLGGRDSRRTRALRQALGRWRRC